MRLETSFPEGVILLSGPNAQGKTSLLEAIYLFTHARSPLAETERHLINFLAQREPQPYTRLTADIHGESGGSRMELRLFYDPAPSGELQFRKEILVNALRKKPSELPGHFHAILFLPHELRVIEGAPADRRRHFDEIIVQADAHYRTALWDYQKVIVQRNALLRSLQEQGGDEGQLDFWDERLAAGGATIILGRIHAVAELERLAEPIHAKLTHSAESFRLVYRPSCDPSQPDLISQGEAVQRMLPIDLPVNRSRFSEGEIRQIFLQVLSRTRRDSIRRGSTTAGPHRDEFRFLANGIDLSTYGSRGQSRTALLSLKLAEVEWMRCRTGQWPVLLLDEVFSELDTRRREDLLENLAAVEQVFLTASDSGMLPDAFRAQTRGWWVEGGTVRMG